MSGRAELALWVLAGLFCVFVVLTVLAALMKAGDDADD